MYCPYYLRPAILDIKQGGYMKRSYIALIIYSLLIDAYTLDKIYEDLSHNAAFQELTPLEIAVEREDGEAINHFAPTANKASLTRSIDQLMAKVDFLYQKIDDLDRTPLYPTGIDVLREKKERLYAHIEELKKNITFLKSYI
jgi:peptidoglycan hydrolase CwlO-like protein